MECCLEGVGTSPCSAVMLEQSLTRMRIQRSLFIPVVTSCSRQKAEEHPKYSKYNIFNEGESETYPIKKGWAKMSSFSFTSIFVFSSFSSDVIGMHNYSDTDTYFIATICIITLIVLSHEHTCFGLYYSIISVTVQNAFVWNIVHPYKLSFSKHQYF